MDLTNEDVADILALLDSLPYDELDLQTTRFRLTLRRTPDGWTQSTQVLGADASGAAAGIGACVPQAPHSGVGGTQAPMGHATAGAREVGGAEGDSGTGTREAQGDDGAEGDGGASAGEAGAGEGGAGGAGAGAADGGGAGAGVAGGGGAGGLVAVRAPLPGTFYRAPRPGAEAFVEVGSRVGADTVVAIVETMKLMNSVTAGADGTVAEICLANGDFAANGATVMRIRADP
jgi:acetyl-CoA carboxylase biotin carboxyl carrier protein